MNLIERLRSWAKSETAINEKIYIFDEAADALERLGPQLEMAWALIANAGGGDWDTQADEWRQAAEKWRDDYHGNNHDT